MACCKQCNSCGCGNSYGCGCGNSCGCGYNNNSNTSNTSNASNNRNCQYALRRCKQTLHDAIYTIKAIEDLAEEFLDDIPYSNDCNNNQGNNNSNNQCNCHCSCNCYYNNNNAANTANANASNNNCGCGCGCNNYWGRQFTLTKHGRGQCPPLFLALYTLILYFSMKLHILMIRRD